MSEDAAGGLSEGSASDVRTVAKGGGVQIAGQLTQRGLSFVFTVVAGALLGRAGYGRYRAIAQSLVFLGQLGLAGFNFAAMRFIAKARATGDHAAVKGTLRWALIGSGTASLVVMTAVLVAAEPIAGLFAKGGQDPATLAFYFRIGAPYLPLFALLQVLRYSTQAYRTMVPSVVAGNIVQPAARFVVATALLVPFGIAGAIGGLAISMGVGALVAGWWFNRLLSPPERAARTAAPFGPIVRFAAPQTLASLLSVQELGYGIILLGIFSSDPQAGLFAFALALQGPGTVFLGGIVNIWAPVVADLHSRGEIDRLESLYQTINRWIATFSFPVFVALILEGDLIMGTFFPTEGAPTAGLVVAILAAGNFFYTGTGPTGYVLSMTGHPGWNAINSVVAMALYFGLGWWAAANHGAVGMAVVDAAVTAVINAARVVEAKILVGIQPFGRTFYKPVVASAAGAAVILLWRLLPGDGAALRWAGLAVGLVAGAAVLWALGLDDEERYVFDRIRRRFARGRGPG